MRSKGPAPDQRRWCRIHTRNAPHCLRSPHPRNPSPAAVSCVHGRDRRDSCRPLLGQFDGGTAAPHRGRSGRVRGVAESVGAEIAVVHLIRHANGPEPVDAFLTSYERHAAGCDHDLVLLCKGFPDDESLARVRVRARSLVTHELSVSDDGLDLAAYLAAARVLPHRRLCFVNSYATIAAHGWLALLCRALALPGTGVAGATGSWESHRSVALAVLRLPNGYRGTLGDRRRNDPTSNISAAEHRLERLVVRGRAALDLPSWILYYPGFPAPHIRTNGS